MEMRVTGQSPGSLSVSQPAVKSAILVSHVAHVAIVNLCKCRAEILYFLCSQTAHFRSYCSIDTAALTLVEEKHPGTAP